MLHALAAEAAVFAVTIPQPDGAVPTELTGKTNQLLALILFGVAAACVLGVLITAGRMAVAYGRGELGESAKGLGGVLIGCLLAGSASALVGFALN